MNLVAHQFPVGMQVATVIKNINDAGLARMLVQLMPNKESDFEIVTGLFRGEREGDADTISEILSLVNLKWLEAVRRSRQLEAVNKQ